jgi:hypothetical protein
LEILPPFANCEYDMKDAGSVDEDDEEDDADDEEG